DWSVTGVQTCALPISPHLPPAQFEQVLAAAGRLYEHHSRAIALAALAPRVSPLPRQRSVLMDALDAAEGVLDGPLRVNAIRILEIGRASCRERVSIAV